MDTFAVRAGMMFDGTNAYGPSTVLVRHCKIVRVDTVRGQFPTL